MRDVPSDRTGIGALLLGRRRDTTARHLSIVAFAFAVIVVLGTTMPDSTVEAVASFRYWQGFVALAVVGVSVRHAYRNDGLLVCIGLAFVFLVALVAGGFLGIATFGGRPPSVALLIGLPLGFAIVLGAVGFLLGAGGRRLFESRMD